MSVSLNGVAHVYITVQDSRACRAFYGALLSFLDMECLGDSDVLYYCAGSRTGIGIRAVSDPHEDTRFDQYRAGLHHPCLRALARGR